MLVKKYTDVDVELRVDKDLMESMNYFDKGVILSKQHAIDHMLDAMIHKMSRCKIDDYNRFQKYVDQLEMYPDNPQVLLIAK